MVVCAACGAQVLTEDQYCPKCGKRLSVLFADSPATTQGTMDLADVRYKLGMVYFKKGEFLRAAETWEKILENNPNHAVLKQLIQDARLRAKNEA